MIRCIHYLKKWPIEVYKFGIKQHAAIICQSFINSAKQLDPSFPQHLEPDNQLELECKLYDCMHPAGLGSYPLLHPGAGGQGIVTIFQL